VPPAERDWRWCTQVFVPRLSPSLKSMAQIGSTEASTLTWIRRFNAHPAIAPPPRTRTSSPAHGGPGSNPGATQFSFFLHQIGAPIPSYRLPCPPAECGIRPPPPPGRAPSPASARAPPADSGRRRDVRTLRPPAGPRLRAPVVLRRLMDPASSRARPRMPPPLTRAAAAHPHRPPPPRTCPRRLTPRALACIALSLSPET